MIERIIIDVKEKRKQEQLPGAERQRPAAINVQAKS
jgi:hypothetical protein